MAILEGGGVAAGFCFKRLGVFGLGYVQVVGGAANTQDLTVVEIGGGGGGWR
ncbi:hypothetical protein TSUD_180920 [Trifolium subterraneum]|uniref:Uncharacterized protein n=1 Tax=Trifolium subterraneum TaxID=3900 RepID=A0A2Z6NII6_TRISU|nr:hypothetical protein TSUD_180920 [Trifolium subterraneum]